MRTSAFVISLSAVEQCHCESDTLSSQRQRGRRTCGRLPIDFLGRLAEVGPGLACTGFQKYNDGIDHPVLPRKLVCHERCEAC